MFGPNICDFASEERECALWSGSGKIKALDVDGAGARVGRNAHQARAGFWGRDLRNAHQVRAWLGMGLFRGLRLLFLGDDFGVQNTDETKNKTAHQARAGFWVEILELAKSNREKITRMRAWVWGAEKN